MKFGILSCAFGLLPSLLGAVSGEIYSNPLRTFNGGDPDIVHFEGWYYFMSTNFANLQMTRSPTLDGLKDGETKQIYFETDAGRNFNIWAPEMHQVDGV